MSCGTFRNDHTAYILDLVYYWPCMPDAITYFCINMCIIFATTGAGNWQAHCIAWDADDTNNCA